MDEIAIAMQEIRNGVELSVSITGKNSLKS
jgi:hypothetical protein